jgi:hypothetical protein
VVSVTDPSGRILSVFYTEKFPSKIKTHDPTALSIENRCAVLYSAMYILLMSLYADQMSLIYDILGVQICKYLIRIRSYVRGFVFIFIHSVAVNIFFDL